MIKIKKNDKKARWCSNTKRTENKGFSTSVYHGNRDLKSEDIETLVTSPDFGIRLLSEIKAEREKVSHLERQIAQDKPKVDFAKALEATNDTIYIGDLAKLLQKNGTNIGQTRLFEWLRAQGYLMKSYSRNTPSQRYLEMGIFDLQENVFTFPNGDMRISKTPMVTVKGQQYFIALFAKMEVTEKSARTAD